MGRVPVNIWGADRRFLDILPMEVKHLVRARLVGVVDRSEIGTTTLGRTLGSGYEPASDSGRGGEPGSLVQHESSKSKLLRRFERVNHPE